MAGKTKQGNQNRKRKFDSYKSNGVAQRNKNRKWLARLRKMEAKAIGRGNEFNYPFKTLEQEQENSKKAAEHSRSIMADRRFKDRQQQLAKKGKKRFDTDE